MADSDTKKKQPEVSVVIPVKDEIGTIDEVFDRLETVFKDGDIDYEILFIDDGSTDGTTEKLISYPDRDPHVRVIRFSRNFGQHLALCAGFEQSRGEIIVVVDADLQVDPLDIPKLVTKIKEGYDVVIGERDYRAESLLSRRLPSWLTNKFYSWFFKTHFKDLGCGLQAFRKTQLTGVDRFSSMFAHLPFFAVWRGAKLTHVPVKYTPRTSGKTKYNWINLMYYFMEVILTFTNIPMQMAYLVLSGSIVLGLGIAAGIVTLAALLTGFGLSLFGILVSSQMILLGSVLFVLGIIVEYQRRLVAQIENAPMFIIDSIIEKPETKENNET